VGATCAADEKDDDFDVERLRVLVTYSRGLRFQMAAVAAVIAAVAWAGGVPTGFALAWLAMTLTVRETRAAWLLRLERRTDPMGPRLRTVTLLTLALGLAYGSAAVFMPRMGTAFDAMVTMILMSLSAGAIATTFTVLPAFVAFGAGVCLPSAAVWAFAGGWPGAGVALLIVLFLSVQVRFARQTLAMYDESFRMRQANNALLAQLSDERGRLAQARDAAVAADLAKSRFLAAASHDLRQPLQSLALNGGALVRQPLPAEAREIAGEMATGIEALRRMLDGLLDISQLDVGAQAPDLRPLSLQRVVQGLVERFRKPAESKGLLLLGRCPPGLTAVSDAQMLQRVLSNLLDNAVKFTASGQVTLTAEEHGDRVRLTVADTGCGIPLADQARVFDDLTQLGNPERNSAQGYGLGLGIVRRLVRLLGIELVLDSEAGAGTRVHLLLPRADPTLTGGGEGTTTGEQPTPSPGLVARRVLVLDDDPGVRQAYGTVLRALGCQVRACATLAEALQTLGAFSPDVALVDVRLGGDTDGLQAVPALRALQPGLPAILISADTGSTLRADAARLGVPLLRKPVTEAVLALAINRVLAEDQGLAATGD
jgi:signal transduction histidine kinase